MVRVGDSAKIYFEGIPYHFVVLAVRDPQTVVINYPNSKEGFLTVQRDGNWVLLNNPAINVSIVESTSDGMLYPPMVESAQKVFENPYLQEQIISHMSQLKLLELLDDAINRNDLKTVQMINPYLHLDSIKLEGSGRTYMDNYDALKKGEEIPGKLSKLLHAGKYDILQYIADSHNSRLVRANVWTMLDALKDEYSRGMLSEYAQKTYLDVVNKYLSNTHIGSKLNVRALELIIRYCYTKTGQYVNKTLMGLAADSLRDLRNGPNRKSYVLNMLPEFVLTKGNMDLAKFLVEQHGLKFTQSELDSTPTRLRDPEVYNYLIANILPEF